MRFDTKTLLAAAITTATMTASGTVSAQLYGWKSNDKWGWSQQTPEKGRQQACRSSQQAYNTLVSMYNNRYRYSKNEQVRRAWQADIEDAKRDMKRWCRG